MAMTAEPSLSPIQVVAGLEGNRDCVECGGPEVAYFVPDFGLFACHTCAQYISSRQVSVKSIDMDIFTDIEVETARIGGNTAFKAFVAAWEVRDRYAGDRPDEYRRRLQAKARGKALLSDQISDSISSLLNWLDCKLTPVLQTVNTTVGSNPTMEKIASVLEGAYLAYEVRVEKEFENENGCLYKLKKQVDDVAVVFQSKSADYQPLLAGSEREVELITP